MKVHETSYELSLVTIADCKKQIYDTEKKKLKAQKRICNEIKERQKIPIRDTWAIDMKTSSQLLKKKNPYLKDENFMFIQVISNLSNQSEQYQF